MPVAGSGSVQRAKAHARWADRYTRDGNLKKATAHLRRALDYGAPSFGAGKRPRDEDSDEEDPRDLFIFDYPDPAWEKYSEPLFLAAAQFPDRRGSFEINYVRQKRDAELAELERLCKSGDAEMCEKQAAFKRLLAQRTAIADDEQARYASRSGAAGTPRDIQREYYKHVLDEHEKDRARRVAQRTDPTAR
jgi:hypothetical protein